MRIYPKAFSQNWDTVGAHIKSFRTKNPSEVDNAFV